MSEQSPQAPKARRGRPRADDPDQALGRATETFWAQGYAGASLDDLSAATGMNRPSLYGAFGDKQALFDATLDRYADQTRAAMTQAFRAGGTLREALGRIYHAALERYVPDDAGGRGCFLVSAGLGQAVVDPAVRDKVAGLLHELDAAFERLVGRAIAAGELPPGADPARLGRTASMMLNALSVRARAGETRAQLDEAIAGVVDLVCGPQASE